MEASPKGLIVAEIATRDGAQGALQIKTPSKACSKNWNGLFCYGGAEANSLSNTFLGSSPYRVGKNSFKNQKTSIGSRI
jgi:hypothetical protein